MKNSKKPKNEKKPEKEKKPDRYRFINSINYSKENLLDDPGFDKDYKQWFINSALSYHMETIWAALEMDKYPDIPKHLHYLCLLNKVRKKKRFSPYYKPDNSLQYIQEYFGYDLRKAKEALKILTPEQLEFIKQKCDKGGVIQR